MVLHTVGVRRSGLAVSMQCGLAVLMVLAVCQSVAAANTDLPTAEIDVNGVTLFAQPAIFTGPMADGPGDAPKLAPVVAIPSTGCFQQTSKLAPNSVMLVERGNCSFVDKVNNAIASGASAVIVMNTLEGMYKAATNFSAPSYKLHVSACDTDCSVGSEWIAPSEVSTTKAYAGYTCSGCGADACALTENVDASTGKQQACCLTDEFMYIGGANKATTVPVVFTTIELSNELKAQAAKPNSEVQVYYRPVASFNLSGVVIWGIGCFAVALSAWCSAFKERSLRRGGASTPHHRLPNQPAEEEQLDITVKQALCFLLGATIMLVGLYLLILAGVNVVLLIMVFYSLGATSSTANLVWTPLVARCFPALKKLVKIPKFGTVAKSQLVAFGIALTTIVVWFICRHEAWAFIPQDFFGIVMCCMFLRVLQLTSLRVGTILLVMFFVYDIFMVFITPLIFQSSVMVEVATAGTPKSIPNQACYCRMNPDDSDYCGPGESMPILFRFPRIADYRGGYSLLGLGDIAIPGMLLSFAMRVDYLKLGAPKCYFPVTMVGYAIGLASANVAVTLMQLGQPALLYIVPMTLVPFILVAWRRGDLAKLWAGPKRSRSEEDDGTARLHAADNDSDGDIEAAGQAQLPQQAQQQPAADL